MKPIASYQRHPYFPKYVNNSKTSSISSDKFADVGSVICAKKDILCRTFKLAPTTVRVLQHKVIPLAPTLPKPTFLKRNNRIDYEIIKFVLPLFLDKIAKIQKHS